MPATAPPALYDSIGSAYDQENHVEVTDSFLRAVRPLLRGRSTALDLGCATGLLTEQLARAGLRVRGVDISATMLRAARQRCRGLPAVSFRRADLRDFDAGLRADAAFACGEIINHMSSERDVLRLFRAVHRNLAPGAVLVFDVLNRWCFEHYWADSTYYLSGPHGDLVMECDWSPATRTGTAVMITFERRGNGSYRRRQAVLHEHLFEERALRPLLRRAGFVGIEARPWSPWPDQHTEESVDRVLWVARVPKG
jgi:SAM-dependent methyltransferase